ncbi:MAG: ribonuclease HII [Armatimonadota bacterium]|nr:ribonuclease HII [Armatimonadota bacterium]
MTPGQHPRYEFGQPDQWALDQGYRLVAGVDETGRGAMAGPLVAAAVVVPEGVELRLVNDSKLLTPQQRNAASEEIRNRAAAWSIGMVEPAMIDRLNVQGATWLAMRRALAGLTVQPDFVLFDGLEPRGMDCEHKAFVGGDACSPRIGAASIMAKVTRDRAMERLDLVYRGYALASNKGYITPEHCRALLELGPSAIHRRRFWRVAQQRREHLPFDDEELRRLGVIGGES